MLLFSLLCFAGVSIAQTSTLAPPPVGTPVSSLDSYDGPYRPQVHFSPPQGFMNGELALFLSGLTCGLLTLYRS